MNETLRSRPPTPTGPLRPSPSGEREDQQPGTVIAGDLLSEQASPTVEISSQTSLLHVGTSGSDLQKTRRSMISSIHYLVTYMNADGQDTGKMTMSRHHVQGHPWLAGQLVVALS
jgi:hypothetical protein